MQNRPSSPSKSLEEKIIKEDDNQALPANVFPLFSRSGVQGNAN
jgi:hypothetical protein